MILIKALVTGLVGVWLCMANISGIVTDTGSIPISGAVVQLETGGQTATTGADGQFTLVVNAAILPGDNKPSFTHNLYATIHKGLLCVNVAKKTAVEVTTFDLAGKALSMVRKTLETGTNSITLPFRGAGIYLCKVKSGNSEVLLKSNTVGGVVSGSAVLSQGSSSKMLAKQAKPTVAIADVIAATKTGYLNYRVVAYNSDTTGIQIKMIKSVGTVTDADGNVYQTVKIGNQEWTVENLRVTKYNDGSPISLDTSRATWNNATIPKFCYYITNTDSIKKYGALYNWYVVNPANTKKIAPAGWHVPSDSEWTVLENYLVLNGYNWDGTRDTAQSYKIAKALATKTDWYTYSTIGAIGCDLTLNNSSGFSALPVGNRYGNGAYEIPDVNTYWWSATENDASNAWFRQLVYIQEDPSRFYKEKCCGFSVRLVRD
jgi:uncharacterized protein (TIGR02145 family)